jgi:hypothetical protein
MLQRLAQDPVAPRLRKTCWRPQSQCVTRWLPARNESQPGPLRRCWSPRSWYGNHQGCDFTAETCDVFASMWVYRGPDTPSVHAYHGLNGLEDTGLIRIGGTGTVPAVIREGDVPEANPFSGDRVMDIEALTIKFQLAGRNSFAAECAYAATEPGEITFRTAKVQVTP